MRVYLPLLFGVRMCFHCPYCNEGEYDGVAQLLLRAHYSLKVSRHGCQNNLGNNGRISGGFAGLAHGMAFANEYQGEATPHGHGFISLANAYQHATLDTLSSLLHRLQKGSVKIHGVAKPVYRADDLQPGEKLLLRCYLSTTQSIAGCQARRRRIGHCLFGFRVVAGECTFVTVSPNRRWSQLIMRLPRIRRNDPMADASPRPGSGHVPSRYYHRGPHSPGPGLFSLFDDESGLQYLLYGVRRYVKR